MILAQMDSSTVYDQPVRHRNSTSTSHYTVMIVLWWGTGNHIRKPYRIPRTLDSGLNSWGWKICRGVGRRRLIARPHDGLVLVGPVGLFAWLWRRAQTDCQLLSAAQRERSSDLSTPSLHMLFVNTSRQYYTVLFSTITLAFLSRFF